MTIKKDMPQVPLSSQWIDKSDEQAVLDVLRSDHLSLGPFSTVPEQVARYDEFWRRRLEVRPGITG